MIRINNIKVSVKDFNITKLNKKIATILKQKECPEYKIAKKSIDCRDKSNVLYIFAVDIKLKDNATEVKLVKKVNNNNIMLTSDVSYTFPYHSKSDFSSSKDYKRPVIIGAGPAGYFATYTLAKEGYKPVLFERGRDVNSRTSDIDNFFKTGKLNPESNVCYGEGGAGTFSDGKLNTGVKDKYGRINEVLKLFVKFGAKESITYDAKPHIGTDVLVGIMQNMRNEIISLGGEIHFESCLTNIKSENSSYILSIHSPNNNFEVNTDCVILAIGHSARDTYEMLYNNGFNMEQKPFALGLRIEHKREEIDKARYGEFAKYLPAADYKLTYHSSNGRSVFSFCMCPGGHVVNSSSEEGCMTINGMSYSGRDGDNSNSAIVCSISPEDYKSDHALAGLEYQKKLEKTFYTLGNGQVPVQLYIDFKNDKQTEMLGHIEPNINGKYTFAKVNEGLPPYVYHAIIEAIEAFDKQIPGFAADDAVLSGIESRTSSPVKIPRDEDFMSNYIGIIPCGEGAGYAGGITSAAVDGIKAAEACAKYLIQKYNG